VSTPRWIKMPLAELTTPKDGRIVYANRYWAITDDDCALFFRSYVSPQCNVYRRIVERLTADGQRARIEFVAIAFVPHNCADYA
jgi:hypothetical protein